MTVLINLLPDIRQAKLRERRRRQLVSGVSILVWIICGAAVALLSVYSGGQKVISGNLTGQIRDNKTKLEAVSGLVDALTAEQHLASLPTLYGQRVYMTKFFQAYTQSDPTDVVLTSMSVDSQNQLIVNGVGASYASVAKLARALVAANVQVGTNASPSNTPYFSNVTITNVSSASKGVSFTMSAVLSSGVTSGAN